MRFINYISQENKLISALPISRQHFLISDETENEWSEKKKWNYVKNDVKN